MKKIYSILKINGHVFIVRDKSYDDYVTIEVMKTKYVFQYSLRNNKYYSTELIEKKFKQELEVLKIILMNILATSFEVVGSKYHNNIYKPLKELQQKLNNSCLTVFYKVDPQINMLSNIDIDIKTVEKFKILVTIKKVKYNQQYNNLSMTKDIRDLFESV